MNLYAEHKKNIIDYLVDKCHLNPKRMKRIIDINRIDETHYFITIERRGKSVSYVIDVNKYENWKFCRERSIKISKIKDLIDEKR